MWSGLTRQLMCDIYSVHKPFLFGHENFKDYTNDGFIDDVKRAESVGLGTSLCSEYAKGAAFAAKLSLYPSFVIDDDLFDVLGAHFAVNAIVNKLKDELIGDGVDIHCYVVPKAVRCLYDPRICVKGEDVFGDTPDYLKSKGVVAQPISFASLREQIDLIADETASTTIVVLIDRRRSVDATGFVFECDDFSAFPELRNNYFIGIDYEVCRGHEQPAGRYVRAWLNFGDQQRLRFFPEQLVSVLPRLFAKSGDVNYKFLQRVYGDAFKHGLSTNLRDSVFEKF